MSNPNVEALAHAMIEVEDSAEYWVEYVKREAEGRLSRNWLMAEFLTKRGVLVISDAVLTDEVMQRFPFNGFPFDGTFVGLKPDEIVEAAQERREALAQLAKGETT